MLFDRQGRCLKTNRTGIYIMGHSATEMGGKTLNEIFKAEFSSVIQPAVEKVLSGERSYFDAVQTVPGQPAIVWNAVLNPYYDQDGNISGFVGIFSDITARASAEEALRDSEEKYRILFESASDAIFVIDAEGPYAGSIVSANNAAARMHGYELEELQRMRIADLDTPEFSRQAVERIGQILSGNHLSFEVEHIRRNGSSFPVEVTAGPITIKGHRYILAFDRDITDRKHALEALSMS